jgi:hypothetical protein
VPNPALAPDSIVAPQVRRGNARSFIRPYERAVNALVKYWSTSQPPPRRFDAVTSIPFSWIDWSVYQVALGLAWVVEHSSSRQPVVEYWVANHWSNRQCLTSV